MRGLDVSHDWPHDRLIDWGLWARCPSPGEGSTAEGYLRERLDHSHDSEPTLEISVTDKAVAQVRIQRRDHYRHLARYYMSDRSEYEISQELRQSIERVTTMLRQARFLVGHIILQIERKSA